VQFGQMQGPPLKHKKVKIYLLINGEEFVTLKNMPLKHCNDEQSESHYFVRKRNPSFLKFLKVQNLKRLNSLRLRTDTGVTNYLSFFLYKSNLALLNRSMSACDKFSVDEEFKLLS